MSETTFSFNGSPDRAAPALVQSVQGSPEREDLPGQSPEIVSLDNGNEGFAVVEEETIQYATPSQSTPGTHSKKEDPNSGASAPSKDSGAEEQGKSPLPPPQDNPKDNTAATRSGKQDGDDPGKDQGELQVATAVAIPSCCECKVVGTPENPLDVCGVQFGDSF